MFEAVSECALFVALEKRDLSPANIIHSKVTSSKSFIYILETIIVPKQIPCGTPGEMFFDENVCPFRTTRFYRYFKKV